MKLFEIPSRAGLCAKGGERFSPGMTYFSELKEASYGGFDRADYCPLCWQKKLKEMTPKIYWKSQISQHIAKTQQNPHLDEHMLQTLKSLIGNQEDEDKAFMLALFLARKKKIVLRQEITLENQGRIQIYEILETEEMIQIRFIDLAAIQIDRINKYFTETFNS